MQNLKALKRFNYGGKTLEIGDVFSPVEASHVDLLTRTERAELSGDKPAAKKEQGHEPEKAPAAVPAVGKKSGAYNTRNLKAK